MRIVIRHLVIAGLLAVAVTGCVGRRYGTSRALYVQQVGERGRWFAACQPTRDTDGDGRIDVRSGPHGAPSGDGLTLFLHLESGPPLIIDALHAATPDDRLLAVAVGRRLVLVDVLSGQRTDVGPAPDWSPIVPRVAFSRDGDSGARRLLETSEWKPNAAAGDFVLLGDDLYDLRTGDQAGTFDDHGWSWKTCRLVGMDASGRVLARPGCDDRGPLLWVQPADD